MHLSFSRNIYHQLPLKFQDKSYICYIQKRLQVRHPSSRFNVFKDTIFSLLTIMNPYGRTSGSMLENLDNHLQKYPCNTTLEASLEKPNQIFLFENQTRYGTPLDECPHWTTEVQASEQNCNKKFPAVYMWKWDVKQLLTQFVPKIIGRVSPKYSFMTNTSMHQLHSATQVHFK